MKVTLKIACKAGKAGEVVEVSPVDGQKLITDGTAAYPSVSDLTKSQNISADDARKAQGLPSMAEYAADMAERQEAEKRREKYLKTLGPMIRDHGLKPEESARREAANARKLANV